MNGIKKAALFLSGLEYSAVDQLLSRFDTETARQVRREMMAMKYQAVPEEESDRLDREFLRTAGWLPDRPVHKHQFANRKTTYTPPKRPPIKYEADSFVPSVCSFDFLRNWSTSEIATAILGEHPQTISVVIAHLPKSKMTSVLSKLPIGLQAEVNSRLKSFEMPHEQVIREIESALKTRYRNHRRTTKSADILEAFDELEALSNAELSTLFRSIDLRTAMLSLIGAEPEFVERVTKRFTPTEEHEIRRQLKQLRHVEEEDIKQARRNVLKQYNETRQ